MLSPLRKRISSKYSKEKKQIIAIYFFPPLLDKNGVIFDNFYRLYDDIAIID